MASPFDSPPPIPQIAQPALPTVTPTPPPTFGSVAPGTKPQAKPSQASFLGSGLTAQPSQMSKPSLLGSFGG